MATPASITLAANAVIVEMTDDVINTNTGNSDFAGGYVRILGTAWDGDAIVDDFIQFTKTNSPSFQQGGVTYCYVPKANYLFIQAALP